MNYEDGVTLSPLPRFEAGEGGDPSRSDGEGEGLAGSSLALPSPGPPRSATAAHHNPIKKPGEGKNKGV